MKSVILCGGKGTRYNQRNSKPILKPLIKIKNKELLERIISVYAKQGVKEFILLGGYKFEQLKRFSKKFKKIKVIAINTGLNTNTAGRLLKVRKIVGKGNFFFTYGDSLVNFNLKKALKLKMKNKKSFLISIFDYLFPYGIISKKKYALKGISEKKLNLTINAGFYVLDDRIFKYIKKYSESFEKITINKVIKSKKLNFITFVVKKWMPMDTKGDEINMINKLK